MSRHNPVLAVAFSMFLIVLLFVLSPIGIPDAKGVKDPNPPENTGPGFSTEAVGGPDAFGYIFLDNAELMGPVYNYYDISATGTNADLSADDEASDPIPIGFTFNFYGQNYSQVQMTTNGLLDFTLSGNDGYDNECPLPDASIYIPDSTIFVLHVDLDLGNDNGAVYYQTFAQCPVQSGGSGACTIFQWENAEYYPSSEEFDFQAILYSNGNIVKHFGPGIPITGDESTTGLQNSDHTIGITYACETTDTITDNLAVCYLHPASGKTDCLPTTLDLVDVNSGVCVFTKSVHNDIHIQGATPNKKVALIMGKKPGSFVIGGNVCNGVQLDLSQPRIVGIYTADINGDVWAQSPVPPSGNLGKAYFQLIDVATCETNEVEQYFLVPDELPDLDFDGDGVLNCDDECPTEGPPGMGEELGPDGCIVLPCEDIIQGDPANDCPCDYFSVPMIQECWTPNTLPDFNPCDNGTCMTLDEDRCEVTTQGPNGLIVGIEAVAIPGEFFCQVHDFGIDGCPADSNMTIEALTETQFRACLCRIEQYADIMESTTDIDITGGDPEFSCSTCDDVVCAVGEVCVEGECVPEATCGNVVVEPGEVCDDGNMDVGDGCNEDCTMIEPGFMCPPAGGACTPVASCGNATVEVPEVCDDGNVVGGDGCSMDCSMVEPGFMCPPGGGPCEPEVLCGNGVLDGPEACDDGNTISGDGCSADCSMTEDGYSCPIPGMPCTLCGNGMIDGTDVCDDGNLMGGDGCSADCSMVEAGYNCIIPGMMCAFCGNGTQEPGEECDDGNTTDGDGCSFDCLMVEMGFVCPIPGMPCTPIMP